jgi:hypothetical protein
MLASAFTYRPLRRLRGLLALVAIPALGCGSTSVEGTPSDAAPEASATGPSTSAETGGDDGASNAADGPSEGGDGGDVETATDTGSVADSTALDAPSEAASADAALPSTWGCAENDKQCDCYDAHVTAGYTQPTCTKAFPCCVGFIVDNGKVSPYHGCDCYSDAYLASLGKTCSEMVDRINGIPIYRSATTAPSCPSP